VPKENNEKFLYDLFFTLFKRKWSIFIVAFTTFAGVIFGTFMKTPLWEATSQIQVDINPKQQLSMFENSAAPVPAGAGGTPSNKALDRLTSQRMTSRLVKEFHLDELYRQRREFPKHPRDKTKKYLKDILIKKPMACLVELGIIQPPDPVNYFVRAMEILQDDLENIILIEASETIKITMSAENNELAANMANSIVDLLIEENLELAQSRVKRLYSYTKEKLAVVEGDCEKFKDRLQKYKEENNIVLLDVQKKVLLDQLGGYQVDLLKTQSELDGAKNQIKEVGKQLAQMEPEQVSTRKDVESTFSSELADNPQVMELKSITREKESELVALLTEKKREHPSAVRLQKEIDLYKKQINEELARVISNETNMKKSVKSETKSQNTFYYDLLSTLNNLKLKEKSLSVEEKHLNNGIDDLTEKLSFIPRYERQIAKLSKRIELQQDIYDELKNRLDQLNIIQDSPFSDFDVKIIEKAVLHDNVKPASPKWAVNIAVGFLASLLLGVCFAFFMEYWRNSYKTVKEMEEDLDLRVIGSLPRYN